ncbi:FAD-binding domain-containing protein [Zopfia rhizophila CBS 207.26]|uniref:Delta(24)-sterol reductase n=1 Tax=Zopfia rhizophila CBS 207.26 TaxID=1314779 RepID=A0A6A6EMU8_9PEZI|nr:FAD-binding domain-containing protein [Zopfia rhizophila CBS 207.26]
MEKHNALVSEIATQVKKFHGSKTPFRIYHGSTLSTRPSTKTKSNTVDISSLSNILRVDTKNKTCLVEPNVPMDALVDATMAKGLLPPVVMELPNITVGGGFAGTSGESSSFRCGTFDCTIKSIEIVLGNGEVMTASASDPETRDVLFGSAGGCGTLGIVTCLELELREAGKYVELSYWRVNSTSEAVEKLKEAEKDTNVDYVEGILFSRASGAIMTGRLTDESTLGRKPQTFDKARDPWFYIHAEDVLKKIEDKKEPYKESIPTKDYLFRYDRGVFWSGTLAFKYFYFPFNALTRYLLDPFMRTRVVNHALHRSRLAEKAIIQDLGVPYDGAEEFVQFIDEKCGFWPLWLCPVKAPQALEKKCFWTGRKELGLPDVLLDIGVWGMGPDDQTEFIKLNREIENKVRELGGLKCLYARAYYTESEFWNIYDEAWYKSVRRKYNAEGLMNVWDKVKVDLRGVIEGEKHIEGTGEKRWTLWFGGRLGGVYGLLSAVKGMMFGGDLLLKRG